MRRFDHPEVTPNPPARVPRGTRALWGHLRADWGARGLGRGARSHKKRVSPLQQRGGHRVSPLHHDMSRQCHIWTCTLHSHPWMPHQGWGHGTTWPTMDNSMPLGHPSGADGLASPHQPCLHPHAQPASPTATGARKEEGYRTPFNPQMAFCRVVCHPLLLLPQTWF